jgi:O-antigen/teichoic acid export membrane protein
MIFEVLSTLLLTPFIIRTLGQAEFGVYKLIVAINGYVLLLDLGIGNATIRYISKYRANNDKENEGKFFGVVTIYYCIIAIMTLIIGFVITYLFPNIFSKGLTITEIELGQKLLILTIITSSITLGTSAFNNILIAYEKFVVSRCSQIIMLIVRLGMSFLVLKLGLGSLALVTINLILTIACRLFFIIYTLSYLKIRPVLKNINKKYIKEIVGYSSMILLQMIATQLNASVDQILIGSLVTSSASILAVYSVGSQINQYFQSIGSAFNGVLMPGVVNLVEKQADGKTLTDEMIRIGRIVFIFLVLILGIFIVEGKAFVVLWAGNDNLSSYLVAVILMSVYIFYLTQSVGAQILWAKNEQKELSFFKLAIVLLNMVFTVILIKWNPLLGATIGTFISIFLGDIVATNIIFYKKIKINLIRYYKELLSGILPSIIIVIIFGVILNNFIGDTWIGFFIKSGILAIIYFAEMILFGFNTYEKNLIYSILKIKNRGGK